MLAPIVKKIVEFIKQEDGPTAVEYAVMMVLIIIVCMVTITTLGSYTSTNFNGPKITSALTTSSS
jgi:pilus assembly protein Flp/PilA